MTLHRSLYLALDGSSLGTVPVDARLANACLIAAEGTSGIGFRSGVFYDGLGAVVLGTATTGTMTYSMRTSQLALPLLGTFASGACILANDGTITVTTTAAPGSNSRIDVIWVRQQAVAADGGADVVNTPILGCTQGTAAASPTVPAIPTGALALAQAVVTAGTTHTDTTTITQVHNWTAAAGAPLMIRNGTEQTALTGFDGLRIYRLDVDVWLTWDAIAGGFVRDAAQLPITGLSHKPRRVLLRTSTAGFADSTLTAVGGWSADTGDDGDGLGLTISGSTITCLIGGSYEVQFQMFFAANGTGSRQVSIWKNGVSTGTQVAFVQTPANSAAGVSVCVDKRIVVSAGDTLSPALMQSSGGSLTCGSAAAGAVFWCVERSDD